MDGAEHDVSEGMSRKLSGDNADLCGIAKLRQELFAVFPGKAEGADVGDADSGHNVANGRKMSRVEFAVHQSRFRPGHQAVQRQVMSQVGGKLFSNGLTRD